MEPIFATPKISKFASVETISAIIQHELQKRFFFLQDSYVEEDIWSSKLVYRQFLLFSRKWEICTSKKQHSGVLFVRSHLHEHLKLHLAWSSWNQEGS